MVSQFQKQLPSNLQAEFEALKVYYLEKVELGRNSLDFEVFQRFQSTASPEVKNMDPKLQSLTQYLSQNDKTVAEKNVLYPLRKPLRAKHSKR